MSPLPSLWRRALLVPYLVTDYSSLITHDSSLLHVVQPTSAEHFVGPHVAFGDEPAAAAEAVIPAFLLRAGQIGSRLATPHGLGIDDFAAIAKLGDIPW